MLGRVKLGNLHYITRHIAEQQVYPMGANSMNWSLLHNSKFRRNFKHSYIIST